MNELSEFTEVKAEGIAKIIKRYSSFLKDYSYVGFREKNGAYMWRFMHKFPEYIFKIIISEKNDKWSVKLFAYWKVESNRSTMGAGKDFELKIGPFQSFSDLVIDVNRRLENNPIMGHMLYDDDYEANLDKEAIPLLIKLKETGAKLDSVKDNFFDDLRDIYHKIKHVPNDKLEDYCRIKNSKEADKQDFLLDLQKLHRLDYYESMKNIGHHRY